MNFWQMQLHPDNPSWDLDEFNKLIVLHSVIGMGDEWKNDRGAPRRFKEEMQDGDIVVLRHQGAPRYLVEVVSPCIKNEGDNKIEVWFAIYRKVRIISSEGDKFKDLYNDETERNWSSHGFFGPTTFQTANDWDFAHYWYNKIIKKENMEKYIDILGSNYNLILTGAPGTGKTYLAKQIAAQLILGKGYDEKTASQEEKTKMNEQCGFVQFHPSYDYTDFVEGLRPLQDESGVVGFERKNGVFKEFCAKAISSQRTNGVDNFEEAWNKLVNELNENDYIDVPFISNKSKTFRIELNEFGTGLANRTYQNDDYQKGEWIKGQSKFFNKDQLYNVYKGLLGVPSGGHDNYRRAIVDEMKANFGLKPYEEGSLTSPIGKPFVFIIDEINRGEISKIFGELFFSIDPGYRGKKGIVQTQYQNMIEDGDLFKNGFFIPENVYIIGTMNDIDRSVESMDFAMRRRFAFKEVQASDTMAEMIKSNDKLKYAYLEIEKRMKNLNDCILTIQGFSSAYQIGAAYFLKLENYLDENKLTDMSWESLWNNHLQGLLFEYLRGLPNADKELQKLHRAYFDKPENIMEEGKVVKDE